MATSKLQRKFGDMLDKNFPQYRIRENYRPDWLISSDGGWLELDFYIEELKIAFEVQGNQHFVFNSFFHKTEENFRKRKQHDQEKRDLCYGRRITLVEICTETDAQVAIHEIKSSIVPPPAYSYSIEHEKQIPTWKHLSSTRRMEYVKQYGSERKAKRALYGK